MQTVDQTQESDRGTLSVAVIAGDGVGPEVVAEAVKVVDALGLVVTWSELDWGTARWREHGEMMPDDGLETLRRHDAVLLGAVGDPAVPDDVSLWGLTLAVRQGLDLWANVRPARLLEGIPTPLRDVSPADVDVLFLRENTEGEYVGAGGRAHRGAADDVAVEVSVFSRERIERLARYAFEQARRRRRSVVSATKSNASRFGYVLWDEACSAVAAEFGDVEYEHVLVDALAARLVQRPWSLDVVVASNLFGDILTDIAAALQGGLGMAASANIAPGATVPGVFEPVHGSAPDIAGRGVANPLAAIWSAALLLEDVGRREQAERVLAAVEEVARAGPKTADVGGTASTAEVGDAVAAAVQRER